MQETGFCNLILRLSHLGMMLGILCSWPLWTARNAFPFLPLWGPAQLESWLFPEYLKTALLLVLLAISAAFPGRKALLAALLCVLLFLVLGDLNKLQPWVWMYALCWILCFQARTDEAKLRGQLLLLFASVYCWSGFNKFTPYFAEGNFPWFCEAFEWSRSWGANKALAYVFAAGELLLGLALIFRPTRRLAAWTALLMHAILLVFLWKHQWNLVVLPWNVILASLVFFTARGPAVLPLEMGKNAWRQLSLWFALLPALFYSGVWPHNLSWRLYDNTQPELTFFLGNKPQNGHPLDRVFGQYGYDNGQKMLLDDWCMGELKVPMFYARTTFKKMARYVCATPVGQQLDEVKILEVHPWDKSREHIESWHCGE